MGVKRMTEKHNQLANQIVCSLINNMMNVCEPNPILKMWFEKEFVKEDYELDWDKRKFTMEKYKGGLND